MATAKESHPWGVALLAATPSEVLPAH